MKPSELFYALTPERVLSTVERLGPRATGAALALNSLENRVYDVELEEAVPETAFGETGRPPCTISEHRVVAKFYRPGRWSKDALLAEHGFLRELAEAEVPVVPPLLVDGDRTLLELASDAGAEADGGPAVIYAALFPRVRGRAPEELDDAQLRQLGRLVGRLHNVGARHPAPARPALTPETYGQASLELLLGGGWIPSGLQARFRAVVDALLEGCRAAFRSALPPAGGQLRLHGDCHLGNLLVSTVPGARPGTPPGFLFVDFDDFLGGPAMQDLWLMAPAPDADGRRQRELLVEGYEVMRAFDRRQLQLVEPLRTLRILRYAAWVAARYADPAFQRAFPDHRQPVTWERELHALEEQRFRQSEAD
jgi:Ser/Thr protein kinase RdoA (MazF antagonist)